MVVTRTRAASRVESWYRGSEAEPSATAQSIALLALVVLTIAPVRIEGRFLVHARAFSLRNDPIDSAPPLRFSLRRHSIGLSLSPTDKEMHKLARGLAVAVALSLAIACGREMIAPAPVETLGPDGTPENLALVAENRDVCSIVVWTDDARGKLSGHRFRRQLAPLATHSDSDATSSSTSPLELGGYQFLRVDSKTKRKSLQAICVVPHSAEGAGRAARYLIA